MKKQEDINKQIRVSDTLDQEIKEKERETEILRRENEKKENDLKLKESKLELVMREFEENKN